MWKEGNDIVAMMSRPIDGKKASSAYAVDVPYLSAGQRLVVSDGSVRASNEVVEDPLPAIGPLGYAESAAMGVVGDHLTRNRGYVVGSARIHRGERGTFVLTTVLTGRGQ